MAPSEMFISAVVLGCVIIFAIATNRIVNHKPLPQPAKPTWRRIRVRRRVHLHRPDPLPPLLPQQSPPPQDAPPPPVSTLDPKVVVAAAVEAQLRYEEEHCGRQKERMSKVNERLRPHKDHAPYDYDQRVVAVALRTAKAYREAGEEMPRDIGGVIQSALEDVDAAS